MQDENSGQGLDFRSEQFQPGYGGEGASGIENQSRTGAIKEKARETKDRVLSKGSDAMRQAKERTRSMADERKNQLGERIHGYGSSIRRAADKLREEKDPNIAHYAEMIADRIDQAGDYLQSRDPGMLLRDVENAARRRPEIFFGGMFLAGLLVARFLKASEQRDDVYTNESDEEYWVEDEAYGVSTEGTDEIAADTNYPMTSGEAAGDWKEPTPTGHNVSGGNI